MYYSVAVFFFFFGFFLSTTFTAHTLAAPSHSRAATHSQHVSGGSTLCLPLLLLHRHTSFRQERPVPLDSWHLAGIQIAKLIQETLRTSTTPQKTWSCFKLRFNIIMLACRWNWRHADAHSLELLCPVVAYLWDNTNLAIGVGCVYF